MECVAIEKKGLDLFRNAIEKIQEDMSKYNVSPDSVDSVWIENARLARILHCTLRTLQSYRERGVIGHSYIGKKIYYKVSEITDLLDSNRIDVANKEDVKNTLKNLWS